MCVDLNIVRTKLIFQFSANTAKNGPNTPAGAIRAKVTKLVQNVDSVISQVSQPTPIFCIQSPKRETVLLKKYKLNDLFDKAFMN